MQPLPFQSLLSLLVLLLSLFVVTVHGTNEEGLQYLKENAEKEGVTVLESGLQIRVLKNGTGILHPGISTPCSCHYHGTLQDGTVFDSSYDRGDPITFSPNQVIKGWTEAMQLMVEGDKWELTIPSDLGYGDRGSPPKIPGGAVLVFQMELLEILDKSDAKPALKCNVSQPQEQCNQREIAFIDKIATWEDDKKKAELKRLQGMKDANVKAELAEWMHRRIHILKQQVTGEEQQEL